MNLAGRGGAGHGPEMKLAILAFSACVFTSSVFAASPVEIVEKLYTEHLAEKGPLNDEKQTGWKSIFAPALLKVLKDAEGWQFDPLLFAQDSDVKTVDVSEIEDGKTQALVLVKFVNMGHPVRLIVSLKKSGDATLIENIIDPATGVDLINNVAN